jgi:hypothetical protein
MNDMDSKPLPLPPPSDVPRPKIPTGSLNGSWGLDGLWTLLRRLIRRPR